MADRDVERDNARDIAIFDAGFSASAEGWNGEHGPELKDKTYIEVRTRALSSLPGSPRE